MTLDIAGSVATGSKAAEELAEHAKPSGGFEKINWFSIKDGEKIVIRMLDDYDEWPSVMQHSFIPTKGAPENATDDQKAKWPKNFGAVCRKTPQFVQFFPDGCFICDHMTGNSRTKDGRYYAQPRLWARAVERERVFADDELAAKYDVPKGTELGTRDAEIEVDELDSDGKATGNKIMKKKILVINMPLSNFFSPMSAYGDVYGTVLDRDYHITRKGDGLNTEYKIVALDPSTTQDADGKEVRWDLRMPEVVDGKATDRQRRAVYLEDAPSLFKLIEDRLDDDLYHRFFDTRVKYELKKKGDGGEGGGDGAPSSNGSSPPAPAKEPEPSSEEKASAKERLAALRAQVKGDHPAPSGASDAPPDPDGEAAGDPVSAGTVSFD